jgi:uncharacterized repeat protein (TIGR03803 family)
MSRNQFGCLRLRVAFLVLATVVPSPSWAGTENVLHTFNAFGSGGNPQMSLIADSAGNLYGTASTGGIVNDGVVFKLTPTASGLWKETILHEFTGGSDGIQPMSGLVFDGAGNLYGTTLYGGGSGTGLVFELSPKADGSWTEKKIYMFKPFPDGTNPQGNLVIDANGNLFGTTVGGGVNSGGTVFELSPTGQNGWKENILYSFTGRTDGSAPLSGVIFDSVGNLYGTTSATYSGYGTVFRLTPSSSGQWTDSTLYHFSGNYDGNNPIGGVVFDGKGNLYGTTFWGGIYAIGGVGGYGVVFQLTPSSSGEWSEKVIWSPTYVTNPASGLVFDSKGNLYGTASGSAYGNCINGCGSVFELSPNASGGLTASVIYNFYGNLDGEYPAAAMIVDNAGNLYGTTASGGGTNCTWISPNSPGGPTGCGTVFKLSPSSSGKWLETQLYDFPGTDGALPDSFASDGKGNFFGTTLFGGAYGWGEVFKLTPSNGKWITTTLYSFTGGSDGGNPNGVILDREGNLYGSNQVGGAAAYHGTGGCGTVFRLSPNQSGTWKDTTLFRFPQTNSPILTGCIPFGNLAFDPAGNLYGATGYGGPTCSFNGLFGCGLVFELSPARGGAWTETILHTFPSSSGDGMFPTGSLVFDSAGNLYGTTFGGGICTLSSYGCGMAFELSPASGGIWTETTLYDFTNGSLGGYSPNGGLIFDGAGNLYGTTASGGQTSFNTSGCGVIFELSPSAKGWTENSLHTLDGANDGCVPWTGLTTDGNGNLYGTTSYGGTISGLTEHGTAFKLSSLTGGWNLSVLYTFLGGSDGGGPGSNVVVDSSGKVYGTTQYDGANFGYYYGSGMGTVFEIMP